VDGALIAHSLDAAIALCQNDEEVFVIGGAELYQVGIKLANKLYITELELDVPGDAYFPAYDVAEWQESSREAHTSAPGLLFSYITYIRKIN
jgi:dihydrofolate reductase